MATYILHDVYEMDLTYERHIIREATHSAYQTINLSQSKFLGIPPTFFKYFTLSQ